MNSLLNPTDPTLLPLIIQPATGEGRALRASRRLETFRSTKDNYVQDAYRVRRRARILAERLCNQNSDDDDQIHRLERVWERANARVLSLHDIEAALVYDWVEALNEECGRGMEYEARPRMKIADWDASLKLSQQ